MGEGKINPGIIFTLYHTNVSAFTPMHGNSALLVCNHTVVSNLMGHGTQGCATHIRNVFVDAGGAKVRRVRCMGSTS